MHHDVSYWTSNKKGSAAERDHNLKTWAALEGGLWLQARAYTALQRQPAQKHYPLFHQSWQSYAPTAVYFSLLVLNKF